MAEKKMMIAMTRLQRLDSKVKIKWYNEDENAYLIAGSM
jgi:hypothetical protein